MQVLRPMVHKDYMVNYVNSKHPKQYGIIWYEKETNHSVVMKLCKTEKAATNWDKKHPPEFIEGEGNFDCSLVVQPCGA
jgi:hypothetical protein